MSTTLIGIRKKFHMDASGCLGRIRFMRITFALQKLELLEIPPGAAELLQEIPM